MPIQIKIEDKTHALEHLASQLSDKNITVANVRAINTAIRKSNTQYRREIVKNYNLKYADTKKLVIPERATYTEPRGTIKGNRGPLSLSRFNPTFLKEGRVFSVRSIKKQKTGKRVLEQESRRAKKRENQTGVSITIQKNQKKNIPFAFLIHSNKPGISQQIWARGKYAGYGFETSKKRMPISALKTVSPFGMMTKDEVSREIKEGASDAMVKELERQVKILLERAGAR